MPVGLSTNWDSAEPALSLQRKLAIGAVNDPLEREADRISDHVMRMPNPSTTTTTTQADNQLQRKCACGSTASGECESCKKEKEGMLRRSSSAVPSAEYAPPIVHDVLRSPGQALDPMTQAFFEPRLGCDLSGVRTHVGSQASESAQRVNAIAYAAGNDIVFRDGAYSPNTTQGRKLLAHELTHVAQQSAGGTQAPSVQRQEQDQGQAQQQGNQVSVSLQTNCSDADARMIGISALKAQRMLQVALDWFRNSTPENDVRLNALLRSHFGSSSDGIRSAVHDRLAKVSGILEEAGKGNVNLNCVDPKDSVCSKREYYAYITQGQGYRINFCRLFFGSGMNAEERVWGMIHESCHLAGALGDSYIFNFGEMDTSACFGQAVLVDNPLQNADSYVNFVWCLVNPGSVVHPVPPITQAEGNGPSAADA
jgi:hypothetical protein